MNRFEKAAYGGDDEYGEYDRWSDGGPAWGLNKQKMIDMTRLFAAEAARRKAQLQFHSDRYGSDMYSPEEAVKRISAVANDKDLDDAENLPNYYNLQYPLKPRSGILETLRLKSPGPIDDWGPEGHPMEAVNRALMGMRSRSGSLKKAAAFGAMMGKMAADPTGKPVDWSGGRNNGGLASVRGGPPPGPIPNGPSSNQPNYPTTGFTPGNKPPEPTFEQKTKAWFDGGQVGSPPKRFANPAEAFTHARSLDVGAGKTTEQRLAAMTPEQRQARTNQEMQAARAERDRKGAENDAYQKWYRDNPGINGHGLQSDNSSMIGLASLGTGFAAGGLTGAAGGGGLGGAASDAYNLGKSFIPAGQGTRAYLGNIAKNSLPYIEPTGIAKAVVAGSKANTGGFSGLAAAGLNSAVEYGKNKFKGVVRGGGPASPSYGQIAASKPNTPQPTMAGNPRNIPGNTMTGFVPNVPRG